MCKLKISFECQEKLFDLLQAFHQFKPNIRGILVLLEIIFCSFNAVFFMTKQVVNKMNLFDFGCIVKPIPFFILTGFEKTEFSLPMADGGWIHMKKIADFTYTIVQFLFQDVIRRQFNKLRFFP